MVLLPDFQSETEMMTDAASPAKLVSDSAQTIHVVQKSPKALSQIGISLTHGACDLGLSVRLAEVKPQRPEDLPETFDAAAIEEILAEAADMAGMDDILELIWSDPKPLDGWKYTQRLRFSELIGLDSNLSIDWIWWSEAPPSWCQAFQQEMFVRGAQESFLGDTEILTCVIGAEEVDLWLKFVAPCTDLATLRGRGSGDVILVRMRGLVSGEGDELPAFVGSVDVVSLLELAPQLDRESASDAQRPS